MCIHLLGLSLCRQVVQSPCRLALHIPIPWSLRCSVSCKEDFKVVTNHRYGLPALTYSYQSSQFLFLLVYIIMGYVIRLFILYVVGMKNCVPI
jgi:hypothetical protein